MKRLLLVCYYFPPAAGGGVARALSFARYLPPLGWNVTVLCADAESAPLSDDSRDLRLPDGVEVVRVAMPGMAARGRRAAIGGRAGRSSGVYRMVRGAASWVWVPDSFAAWVPEAVRVGRELVERTRFNAMLTTSPPDSVHLVGLELGVKPWVVDFRDPWIGLTYKRPPTPFHAWRQRRLRRAVLSRGDLFLATTKTSADLLRDASARVEILPNGWDPDVAPPAASPRAHDKLRLVYTGTLWDVPATRTFLEALAAVPSAAGAIDVELIGPHESDERTLVERLGLTDIVHFLGQVPYEESRRRQAEADVLLLLQVHGPGYEAAIPGKLYEYLASGRPILAFLPDGEAADLVRKMGGWVVGPEDARGAQQTIGWLVAGQRPGGESFERRALADVYRRDRIAHRLAGLLDRASSSR